MTDDTPAADGGTATSHGHPAGARPARTRLRAVLDFAGREYRVVFRSGWPIGLALAFALLSVTVVTFGRSGLGRAGTRAVVVSLTELGVYLVPLAALAFGYGAVVEPRERGTLELLLALPVPRWVVAVGVYAGRAGALAGALLVGFGAGGLALFRFQGAAGWGLYLGFVAAAIALALAFLGIALAVSTLASEKSHALGGVLLVWVWFVLVFDVLAFGLVAAVDLPPAATAGLLLANPVDVFRLFVLASAGAGAGGYGAILAAVPLDTSALAVGALAWVIAPVGLGAWLLGWR
ncbi:ABC transporter permease [Halosegnis sp.]|uniref:ABC transporter permease n=1 Tax=Halosegnis sp. TaxID=2864959 RepID=UPI0035D40F11